MNNNQGHSGGFFSGFLWGAFLGAGAVLLLNTKKGKRLLKTLTEEGADGIANLEELITEVIGEKEEEIATPKEKSAHSKSAKHTNGEAKYQTVQGEARSAAKVTEIPIVQKILTPPRRFFKGIKKKA